jgi:hypothetical protein
MSVLLFVAILLTDLLDLAEKVKRAARLLEQADSARFVGDWIRADERIRDARVEMALVDIQLAGR